MTTKMKTGWAAYFRRPRPLELSRAQQMTCPRRMHSGVRAGRWREDQEHRSR